MFRKYHIVQKAALFLIIIGNLVNSMNLEQLTVLNRHTITLFLLKSGKLIGVNLLLILIIN